MFIEIINEAEQNSGGVACNLWDHQLSDKKYMSLRWNLTFREVIFC